MRRVYGFGGLLPGGCFGVDVYIEPEEFMVSVEK